MKDLLFRFFCMSTTSKDERKYYSQTGCFFNDKIASFRRNIGILIEQSKLQPPHVSSFIWSVSCEFCILHGFLT